MTHTAWNTSELTFRFMLAARQRELQGMQALAETCDLVMAVGELVHALQKERGQASLHLTRPDPERLARWQGQVMLAQAAEQRLRDRLASAHPPEPLSQRPRWLHAVAHALHGLDGLPGFRMRQSGEPADLTPVGVGQAVAQYSRIIGSLLGVVIEALEGPADAQVTQCLVALLNFMQAKELCGQERAQGGIAFASGQCDAERQSLLQTLWQAQVRSFELFNQHAPEALREALAAVRADEAALQRLRDALRDAAPPSPALAPVWFDVCTARIDALHDIEQQLAQHLAGCAEARALEAQQALAALEAAQTSASGSVHGAGQRGELPKAADAHRYFEGGLFYTLVGRPMAEALSGDEIGDGLARSVLDVLLAQGERLHQADEALAQARRAKLERRRIEQAKWWLVSHHGLSESAAHERLQRTAMNTGKTLIEVADQVLQEADNS